MNEGVGHALDQAIAFWRAPALLANARHRPLPDDVLDVVRIAANLFAGYPEKYLKPAPDWWPWEE